MHEIFTISMSLEYQQEVYFTYRWQKGKYPFDEADWLIAPNPNGCKKVYNPFREGPNNDNPFGLLPKLAELVEKKKNGGDKKKLMLKWVKEYGFLGSYPVYYGNCLPSKNQEEVGGFWFEAERIATLWERFVQLQRSDFEALKTWIKLQPDELQHSVYVDFSKDDQITVYHNPQIQIQPSDLINIAMHYLIFHISQLMQQERWTLHVADIKQILEKPVIFPKVCVLRLIDALYWQLLLLVLNQDKIRICEYCHQPFIIAPKDADDSENEVILRRSEKAKYCSESCYQTAKVYRYRKRKAKNK
mgnify:CR=1 FL=1